jgi:hypothetical protein
VVKTQKIYVIPQKLKNYDFDDQTVKKKLNFKKQNLFNRFTTKSITL